MMEKIIYFNVGFKSFDVTRWSSGSNHWFDWVERSKNRMRRITLGKKTMEWLCYILEEASSDQKNSVRRWRTKDQGEDFYGTRMYNEHGKYMSILSLKGEAREVTIVPELAINAGWRDIAFKIEVVEDSKSHAQSKEESYDEKGLLGRCLTSSFNTSEPPTLADVRRWATSIWKKAFSVNIYEMAGKAFLSEFPNRFMAEQTLQGNWV
ncbi:unnamed protein product [Withania somnifera]